MCGVPRTLPDPTPDQSSALDAVAHAAQERAKWNQSYFDAIVDAHLRGCTAVQIAKFTDTSYQAVQQILARGLTG